MNITIKATHTTLTEAIRNDISDKVAVIEKFLRPEDKIHVELEEDTRHTSGRFSRVEIAIHPRGMYADARGNDFYEAMDLVVPKIKEQLTRGKDKRVSLRRKLGNLFKRGEK
jgi:ribosomal subunit interface protein